MTESLSGSEKIGGEIMRKLQTFDYVPDELKQRPQWSVAPCVIFYRNFMNG